MMEKSYNLTQKTSNILLPFNKNNESYIKLMCKSIMSCRNLINKRKQSLTMGRKYTKLRSDSSRRPCRSPKIWQWGARIRDQTPKRFPLGGKHCHYWFLRGIFTHPTMYMITTYV